MRVLFLNAAGIFSSGRIMGGGNAKDGDLAGQTDGPQNSCVTLTDLQSDLLRNRFLRSGSFFFF